MTTATADALSRAFVNLVPQAERGKGFYRREGQEPLFMQCLFDLMRRKGEVVDRGAAAGQTALESEAGETVNSGNRGPLGELAMELILQHIGQCNQQLIAQQRPPLPLSELQLFAPLMKLGGEAARILQSYAIVATEVAHEPKAFHSVLRANGTVDCGKILANISNLMRPDLAVGLLPLNPSFPIGLLTVGSRLYSSHISSDNFIDNCLTTDRRRFFLNEFGLPLGTEEDRDVCRKFNAAFKGPSLRMMWVYGGVALDRPQGQRRVAGRRRPLRPARQPQSRGAAAETARWQDPPAGVFRSRF